MPHPDSQRLTPLERELLSLVERLNAAFEQTSQQLADLEQRSTALLSERLTSLEASLGNSIAAQTHFNEALADWLMQPAANGPSPVLIQALNDLKACNPAPTSC